MKREKAGAGRLVVVLGMHRSGTSAITRGLKALGVELGSRLLPADTEVNPTGYWEDEDIYDLNVNLLKALGTDWHHLTPISNEDVKRFVATEFFSRAVALVRDKVGNGCIFGIKDPRLCMLLPFWKRVFAHCQLSVSYLLTLRNPVSVAGSLAKRDRFDHEKSALLWLIYMVAVLEQTAKERSRIIVDYDMLVDSPPSEIRRIGAGLGLTIDEAELGAYCAEFLRQDLRHGHHAIEDCSHLRVGGQVSRNLYTELRRAAMGEIELDHPKILEHIRTAKRAITSWSDLLHLLDASLRFKRDASDELRRQASDLAGCRSELEQVTKERDLEREAHIGSRSALEELKGRFAHVESEYAVVREQSAGRASSLQRCESTVEALRMENQTLGHQIINSKQIISDRDRELEERRKQVSDYKAELQRLERMLESQSGCMTEIAAHRNVLEGAVTRVTMELEQARRDIGELRSECRSTRDAFVKVREEADRLLIERESLQRTLVDRETQLNLYGEALRAKDVQLEAHRSLEEALLDREAQLKAHREDLHAKETQLAASYSEVKSCREKIELLAGDIKRLTGRCGELSEALNAREHESLRAKEYISAAKSAISDIRAIADECLRKVEARRLRATSPADRSATANYSISLESLLELDGAEFVTAAYRVILRRLPDLGGRHFYVHRLASGIPKLTILRELWRSAEGRKAGATIRGLAVAVGRQRFAELPIVGRPAAFLFGLESSSPAQRRLRVLQQRVSAAIETDSENVGTLESGVRLIHDLVSRRAVQLARSAELWDGMHTQSTQIAPQEPATREVPIRDRKPVLFQIDYAATASPATLGMSTDTRELAIGFQRLRIRDELSNAEMCDLDFRAEGNSADFTLFGFSEAEPWGAWSNGKTSAFLAWSHSDKVGPLDVLIEASPFSAFTRLEGVLTSSAGHCERFVLPPGGGRIHLPTKEQPDGAGRMFFGGMLGSNSANNVSLLEAKPRLSIIILNYNKPQLSLLSARAVIGSGISSSYEIIIVDNGSTAENASILDRTEIPVRVHRIPCNRFFGEGNNLGAEVARGKYLLFLNNDAFPAQQCIDRLLDAFDACSDCGIAGPVFRYPDGRLQEAGAFIRADGSALQRGKNDGTFEIGALDEFESVDYVSAACLMIRADLFRDLGGFNYRFDPAYYEDTDLCFRTLLRGVNVVLAKDATCYHIENASTADKRNASTVGSPVEHNRKVFLSIWGQYLESRAPEDLPKSLLIPKETNRVPSRRRKRETSPVTQASYSPYPLVPGGGERYILATALALGELGDSAFVTPDPFSSLRVDNVMHDLGLPTGTVTPMSSAELRTHRLERAVVMGNELYPSTTLPARRQFFHCQFPFPLSEDGKLQLHAGMERLRNFEKVIVNSEFTRSAYRSQLASLGYSACVEVVNPPVATRRLLARGRARKPWILSIGRFSAAGHSKRQDVLIDAFKATSVGFRKDWKLILCGTVPNNRDDRAYFKSLQESIGSEVDVEFVLSPSTHTLDSLLSQATIYAHACGFGVRSSEGYAKCEHFGITLVEALVAGCQVISYEIGGGPEIFAMAGAGRTFGTIEELAWLLEGIDKRELELDIRQRVSECYDDSAFSRRMCAAVQ